jgi:hypothetical protein
MHFNNIFCCYNNCISLITPNWSEICKFSALALLILASKVQTQLALAQASDEFFAKLHRHSPCELKTSSRLVFFPSHTVRDQSRFSIISDTCSSYLSRPTFSNWKHASAFELPFYSLVLDLGLQVNMSIVSSRTSALLRDNIFV